MQTATRGLAVTTYLDYSQVSARLRKIRGPYTIPMGLAVYEKHLGVTD